MNIDLHIHSSDRSDCGLNNDIEQVQAAITWGLDAMVFTDHERLIDNEHLNWLNARHTEITIFGGIEVPVAEEHVLVLGVHDYELEKPGWTWPELHRFVRDHSGVLILAHPYRWHNSITIDVEKFPPDAIEINSCNMGGCDPARIDALIKQLGVHPVSNSDGHSSNTVGMFYNQIDHDITTEAELLSAITSGALQPRRSDHRIELLNQHGWRLR